MVKTATSPRASADDKKDRRSEGILGSDISLDSYPFYLIGHADHRYAQEMEAVLGRRTFSRPKWRSLASLSIRNGMSIGEMAEVTLLKRSTLSRVVERMEGEGLVTRRPRPDDNRITEVYLTEAGRAAFTEILEVARGQYVRATEGLSAAEIDQLCRTLKKMLHNLERSPYASGD